MKLYFDHANKLDKGHRLLSKLAKMGFSVDEREVEHPGRSFCRFILFDGKNMTGRSYLEFIDVRGPNKRKTSSGLSFGIDKNLKRFTKQVSKKLPVEFTHKNYNWKTDNVSYLPGWNFATFPKSGIKSYTPWITEYELGHKAAATKPPKHKNTVSRILEIHLTVNINGLSFYQTFLSLPKGAFQIRLRCGALLKLKKGRNNSFDRLVLGCDDFTTFAKVAQPQSIRKLNGKAAAFIKSPPGWKIVVVENE